VQVILYFIGKPRNPHANAIAEEFIKRTGRYARCRMLELDPRRTDPWTKHPAATKVVLDPAGRTVDSRQFTKLVGEAETAARDLIFIVGGADGLPVEWRPRAARAISLSPMTLPHELARAMLAEQIYRAFTTLRGHPYPR
jgi:23S rRNA (pseudouridine1915-N3)-methyltransferase